MKKPYFLVACIMFYTSLVFAYENPLETRNESRERQRSNEYQTRQNNPYGGQPYSLDNNNNKRHGEAYYE